MLDEDVFHLGPGKEYAKMAMGIRYDTDPVIIAVEDGWVLLEYIENEELTPSPLYYRGWTRLNNVLVY